MFLLKAYNSNAKECPGVGHRRWGTPYSGGSNAVVVCVVPRLDDATKHMTPVIFVEWGGVFLGAAEHVVAISLSTNGTGNRPRGVKEWIGIVRTKR